MGRVIRNRSIRRNGVDGMMIWIPRYRLRSGLAERCSEVKYGEWGMTWHLDTGDPRAQTTQSGNYFTLSHLREGQGRKGERKESKQQNRTVSSQYSSIPSHLSIVSYTSIIYQSINLSSTTTSNHRNLISKSS